jgi:hypothetical protein
LAAYGKEAGENRPPTLHASVVFEQSCHPHPVMPLKNHRVPVADKIDHKDGQAKFNLAVMGWLWSDSLRFMKIWRSY